MPDDPAMTVRILLPHRELPPHHDVLRLVAETAYGSFGMRPRRLDCTLLLTPGIFTLQSRGAAERFVAVDEGVLVKAGLTVTIAVRRAREGDDLESLRTTVTDEFLAEATDAHELRAALSKLETGFLTRLAELTHD
ncbi:MAG: F0F1 ATP synthase subunit epsilon [Gemmatimonadaceae bacterium]|nr:F0F1 ATP synthase subunit epsilon [Gemmatimonadaceae bacterium]